MPRRLSHKLSAQLAELDYTHANATRISSEVRRALKFPADKLREGLQRSVEQLLDERKEKIKLQGESDVARKYFGNLVRESGGSIWKDPHLDMLPATACNDLLIGRLYQQRRDTA